MNSREHRDQSEDIQKAEYANALKEAKKRKSSTDKFSLLTISYDIRNFILPYADAVEVMRLLSNAVKYTRGYSDPPKLLNLESRDVEMKPLSAAEMDDIRVGLLLNISEERARGMRDGTQDIPF